MLHATAAQTNKHASAQTDKPANRPANWQMNSRQWESRLPEGKGSERSGSGGVSRHSGNGNQLFMRSATQLKSMQSIRRPSPCLPNRMQQFSAATYLQFSIYALLLTRAQSGLAMTMMMPFVCVWFTPTVIKRQKNQPRPWLVLEKDESDRRWKDVSENQTKKLKRNRMCRYKEVAQVRLMSLVLK